MRSTIDIKINDNSIIFESNLDTLLYIRSIIEMSVSQPEMMIFPLDMILELSIDREVSYTFFKVITKLGRIHDVTVWVKVTKLD